MRHGKVKIIVNPAVGGGQGERILPDLCSLLDKKEIVFDLECTTRPWEAAKLAEQAMTEGHKVVVAVGGDGTVNEVVNGLMVGAKGKIAGILGIIPLGSGNDTAFILGIPPDLEKACKIIAQGWTRLIDVGVARVDNKPPCYFVNGVGIGFDAVVAIEARKVRLLRGFAMYLWAVLKTIFFYYKAPVIDIEFNGETIDKQPIIMISVANGSRYGGGFLVAPEAQIDDGYFDLCIAQEISRLKMFRFIPEFMRGSHIDKEPITMARARRVVITSKEDLPAHADGEILCTDAHRLEFENLPHRLRVLC